jgi:phosphopantothenoylcysteine decarboxylase/phosphopantothenate--cysteine ligase
MKTPSDPGPGVFALQDLVGREVLIGVCGGIAAYKVADVASKLVQRGAGVTVAMTRAAQQFVGELTFQALTGRRVLTDDWTEADPDDIQHIALTDRAELLIIAPATANILGKIACGIADDIVSTLAISTAAPILLAPAMNSRMWANAAVQANVSMLTERGFRTVGPGEGWLACRTIGVGRMADPGEILESAVALLRRHRQST